MDLATVLGLIVGFAMMGGALAFMGWHSGGQLNLAGFIDPPSFMMVVGGTFAVALVGFPLYSVLGMARTVKRIFFRKPENLAATIEQLVELAEVARRDGILALENRLEEVRHPFIMLGIRMAVDGIKPETVEEVLRTEMKAAELRHVQGKKVFELMGRCGPAFGMMTTLFGLILMLGNLSNADAIGPSMALALVGTLYGVVAANLIYIPLSEKLWCMHTEEMLAKEIVLRGVLAIQSGDSPRIVEQKLIAFLPPKFRPPDAY